MLSTIVNCLTESCRGKPGGGRGRGGEGLTGCLVYTTLGKLKLSGLGCCRGGREGGEGERGGLGREGK